MTSVTRQNVGHFLSPHRPEHGQSPLQHTYRLISPRSALLRSWKLAQYVQNVAKQQSAGDKGFLCKTPVVLNALKEIRHHLHPGFEHGAFHSSTLNVFGY